jgi:hypothetical protein
MAALASGLETRNQLRKRQEKNEFYFQFRQKNFLDGKKKRACRPENGNDVSKKFHATQNATIPNAPLQTDFGADSSRIPS